MRYDWNTMLPERAFRTFGRKIVSFEGGGGGGGNTTSTTTNVNYSPEEAARRAQVMDEAARIYGQTQPQLSRSNYPGSVPVPFSMESLAAQNMATQAAFNAQPAIADIQQGVRFGMTDARDVRSNPYLQNAIQAAINPITASYTDPNGVMAQIRSGAREAGQFGGSRQGIAEGIAAGKYAQAVGDAASKMASAGYERGLDTFEKTLMFAPQALETQMMPVQWLSGVGAQKENLAQMQEDYLANQRMWGLNAPWLGVQNYANIVFGAGSGGGTSTTTGQGASMQRSPLMGALGGAAMGASLTGGSPIGMALGALVGLFG